MKNDDKKSMLNSLKDFIRKELNEQQHATFLSIQKLLEDENTSFKTLMTEINTVRDNLQTSMGPQNNEAIKAINKIFTYGMKLHKEKFLSSYNQKNETFTKLTNIYQDSPEDIKPFIAQYMSTNDINTFVKIASEDNYLSTLQLQQEGSNYNNFIEALKEHRINILPSLLRMKIEKNIPLTKEEVLQLFKEDPNYVEVILAADVVCLPLLGDSLDKEIILKMHSLCASHEDKINKFYQKALIWKLKQKVNSPEFAEKDLLELINQESNYLDAILTADDHVKDKIYKLINIAFAGNVPKDYHKRIEILDFIRLNRNLWPKKLLEVMTFLPAEILPQLLEKYSQPVFVFLPSNYPVFFACLKRDNMVVYTFQLETNNDISILNDKRQPKSRIPAEDNSIPIDHIIKLMAETKPNNSIELIRLEENFFEEVKKDENEKLTSLKNNVVNKADQILTKAKKEFICTGEHSLRTAALFKNGKWLLSYYNPEYQDPWKVKYLDNCPDIIFKKMYQIENYLLLVDQKVTLVCDRPIYLFVENPDAIEPEFKQLSPADIKELFRYHDPEWILHGDFENRSDFIIESWQEKTDYFQYYLNLVFALGITALKDLKRMNEELENEKLEAKLLLNDKSANDSDNENEQSDGTEETNEQISEEENDEDNTKFQP